MAKHGWVFTLTPDEWTVYKEAMRAIMIRCAREKRTITYSDLAGENPVAFLHPHSFMFASIMRKICAEEYDRGHGQLCALVVSKLTGMPSAGYFRSLSSNDTDPTLDAEARWRQEMADVFAYWEHAHE
jgi:hypothetical protein